MIKNDRYTVGSVMISHEHAHELTGLNTSRISLMSKQQSSLLTFVPEYLKILFPKRNLNPHEINSRHALLKTTSRFLHKFIVYHFQSNQYSLI